jgi:hypothetical protein
MFARPPALEVLEATLKFAEATVGSQETAIIDEILTELGDAFLHTEYCLTGLRRILPGLSENSNNKIKPKLIATYFAERHLSV